MQIVICLVAIWYVAVAAMLFSAWYQAFQRDQALSTPDRQFSWVALLVPTVFWFVCLPLNYLELLRKRQQEKASEAYASQGSVPLGRPDRPIAMPTIEKSMH
jgi:hypothetical protein